MTLVISFILYCIYFIFIVITDSQQPEINDQFENQTVLQTNNTPIEDQTIIKDNEILTPINSTKTQIRRTELVADPNRSWKRITFIITQPFVNFIAIPKVNSVLRNIGTCVVNGAMEIITYYFPAPLIPLIAGAAGMIIPFEPVVMLREKMPVTSYRRAFKTALNGFLSTFDAYRHKNDDDDPYMTRRFNRRFMQTDGENKV